MGFRGEGPPVPEEARSSPENKIDAPPAVPESEIDVVFVRSSGPGGQNVNKTSTKAQLRWNVGRSGVFTDEQKAAIRAAAGNRLSKEDEIVLFDQSQRSQPQNREAAVARLQELVAEALAPRKERKETKVSRGEKQRRLEDKRRQSEKKQWRKPPKGGW